VVDVVGPFEVRVKDSNVSRGADGQASERLVDDARGVGTHEQDEVPKRDPAGVYKSSQCQAERGLKTNDAKRRFGKGLLL